jgi:glycosyltransferase involved in cell wall biosynthesis
LVGYVGRLVKQKGLLVLLEAIALINPEVHLSIVGSGPLKQELLMKINALGLNGRVELHEGISHQEVPRYLREMSVLVLPSLTTPRWKEQFGHVLIEAMAIGVPVIGSDSGAIREVVGDAGLIVPEGSAEAIAAALAQLFSSPALRAELVARGHERVRTQFTDDVVATRLRSFWDTICRTP